MRLLASLGWVEVRELAPTAGLGAAPRFPQAGTGVDPQGASPSHATGRIPPPAQGDASALSCLAGMLACMELAGGLSLRCTSHPRGDRGGDRAALHWDPHAG